VPSFGSGRGDVLYLIVCRAPPARRSVDRVKALRADGWEVCAITTPAALAWVDVESLGKATGHPVRTEFRGPDDAEFAPRGDAVLVAPASFNTINKCAAGINDNLGLGLINEALGSPSIPIALLPWVNGSLNDHPAYRPSLGRLRDAGVHIIAPTSNDLKTFDRACVAAGDWLKVAASESAPSSS
jgi:phosphopantothenoylcysteine synthetase/decarboxylase